MLVATYSDSHLFIQSQSRTPNAKDYVKTMVWGFAEPFDAGIIFFFNFSTHCI